MNVRTLLASAALCGTVLFCGAQAKAGGFIFGYAGGATFKGEVYGYGYGCGGYGCGGYGCGGSGCGGHGWGGSGCDTGNCGGKLFGGKSSCGGCSSGKCKLFGKGKGCGGCDGGCDYGCDNCYQGAPMEGTMPAAPEPKTEPTPAANEASNRHGAFRAVAHERLEGASFAEGWQAYRKGNYRLALETLSAVVIAEPNNAAAHYGLALSHLQLGDRPAADAALAGAAAVETEHPIAGYGKLMERVQGCDRLWLEAARR